MKPLSEQALEEEILVILRYPNGKRSPRNSIAEEIRHEQAEKLLDLILSDRKARGKIKRFVDNHNAEYDDFTLGLNAGYVSRDGRIGDQQRGIEATFSIGMPVYGKDSGEFLGRLKLHLYKHLNYSTKTADGEDIPVEGWEIDSYTGNGEHIVTYHQQRQRNQGEKTDEQESEESL